MYTINEEKEIERKSWDRYFMDIALIVSNRSTCLSAPKGAVIVKDKRILTTGYSGAPSGISDCKYDNKYCYKRKLGFNSGEGHDFCLAVHAEANAILQAASLGISIKGTTMYCTHKPCFDCFKLIINSDIQKIIYLNEYPSSMVEPMRKEWETLADENVMVKMEEY